MLEPTQCCALRSKKWISSISGSPAALVTKPIRSPGGGSGRRRLANVRPTALQKPPASVLAPRRSSSWIQIVVSHTGARLSLWPPPWAGVNCCSSQARAVTHPSYGWSTRPPRSRPTADRSPGTAGPVPCTPASGAGIPPAAVCCAPL